MKVRIAILIIIIFLVAAFSLHKDRTNKETIELNIQAEIDEHNFDDAGEFRGLPFQLIAVSGADKKAVVKTNEDKLLVISENQTILANRFLVQRITNSTVVVKSLATADTNIVHLLGSAKKGMVVNLSSTTREDPKRVLVTK